MKHTIITLITLTLAALFVTGCSTIQTRYRWASYGDVPLLCCGSPGSYIQHFDKPTYQQASLEYIQLINLPGGCGALRSNDDAEAAALDVEAGLYKWKRGVEDTRLDAFAVADSMSPVVAKALVGLRAAILKGGPDARATHGPPCFERLTAGLP